NSVQFIEPSGNGAIDANELSHLRFKVKNSGLGAAYGCMVRVYTSGSIEGLTCSNQSLPILAVGETETIEIPIQASIKTTDGTAHFTVKIDEPNGFGTDPIQLAVNTKAFEAPLLKIVDFTVTGDQVGTLVKKRPFDLQLLLQNTQYGTAEDVMVEVKIPAGVYLIDDNKTTKLQSLGGGDKKSLVYSLIVNNNYVSDIIPIEVIISEKYRKYSENKVINLKINQTLASNKIVVDEKPTARSTIQIGSLGSDVDKNIPIIKTINDNVFAVVIANEHYNKVSPVPYALNDGRVFAEYCGKTLGLPAKNIRFVQNATLNDLKYQVDWLRQIIGAYNGKAKVIFYYAGHGIPDESNKTAYLLPIDGYGSDVNTGYKLDDLYATLGKMPTQSVTVILDACFSGTKREGDMLANARGVAIRVKSGLPQGNMVVFTAAQGDETAYPNSEQEHGLFTYYLLKKLQETKGEVSYQQLSDYVTRQVRQQSLVLNGKSQTPTIISSPNIADEWKLWTLK
ncbi:MAG: caspase family protein, partial [Prevotellaceae bacterium]|nr:caspase family protein [Prevotellaceae bacterium]